MPLFKDFPTPKAGGRDSDVVGSVRTGRLDERTNRPYSLDTLRFTADHMDIVTKIAELYGGTPGEWSTTKSDRYEVITEAAAVNFELRTFDVEFILWGQRQPIRVCDGRTQKDDGSTACECPSDYWDHRAAASEGKACKPNVKSSLVLADAPDLGVFRFQSGSWMLAEDANEIEAFLSSGPAQVQFAIEQYQTKQGQTRQRPRFTELAVAS
jgi:hypothetical protein